MLYMGMFRFWRPMSAKATLDTYSRVTGVSAHARWRVTGGNSTMDRVCEVGSTGQVGATLRSRTCIMSERKSNMLGGRGPHPERPHSQYDDTHLQKHALISKGLACLVDMI